MRPLPVERASKTDLVSVLAAYQQYILIPIVIKDGRRALAYIQVRRSR